MGRSSPPRLLVLHGLRLKGFASPDALVEATGLDATGIGEILEKLQAEGFVVHREGRLTGYSLNADGRAEHSLLLAAELGDVGGREAVADEYQRFLKLNPELLAVCTRWQLRDVEGGVVNDHTDAAYDAAVIDELVALDEEVQPVCDALAQVLDRYTAYGPRLTAARHRLCDGEVEFFTKPIIESYHTVWFELHEDLLATLGIERAAEGSV